MGNSASVLRKAVDAYTNDALGQSSQFLFESELHVYFFSFLVKSPIPDNVLFDYLSNRFKYM